MSTITLCHLYRILQWVLRQSRWQSISAAVPSLRECQGSKDQSSIDEWISRPFPGFWTCKSGFLLWRSPCYGTKAQTDVRAFCLSSIDDTVLGNLTRVYWHALCRPSLLPRQCQARILPKIRLGRTECRKCHDATLRVSNLKGNHKRLLRLLIDQSYVTGSSNRNLVLRNLETLKSTKVQCWNSRAERFTSLDEPHDENRTRHHDSNDIVGDKPHKLNQGCTRALDSANQIQPSITSGVNSDTPNLLFPPVTVFSTMKATLLKSLRVVGLSEPLLERGKCRVRCKCVSNPW